MKRRLLTPDMENMTDTASIFSFGVLRTGAPARVAMSASPVASMTRLARIASRPALLSVMTPQIAPFSMMGATPRRCSSGLMPASSTRTSATHLNISASSAWLKDCGSGIAAPMAFARVSNSMPIPSQSTVCSCRYQAKPSTPTCVMLPPKQPLRSIRVVRAPARAAASAAARPPGPLPTTRTSVSSTTSSERAGSAIVDILNDRFRRDWIGSSQPVILGAAYSNFTQTRTNCMSMKVTRLTRALGAMIEGIDLSSDLPDSTIDRLNQLLVEHEVMFFPRQPITPQAQCRLAARFGPLHVHPIYPVL